MLFVPSTSSNPETLYTSVSVQGKLTKIDAFFRRNPFLLPIISFCTLALLFIGIIACMEGFSAGYYWTVLPAALMAHAFFIICIHDGSHRSITRSKWDDLFMNVFAGVLLLPFFPEPFRRYHMIHHANTNTENDPLWSPVKDNLFTRHRYIYILCQFIPLLFTVYVLASSEKSRKKKNIKGPSIRYHYMFVSFMCSFLVLYLFKIPILFYLSTLFFLTMIGGIRHWCEHMGTGSNIESNTFWFPLGMGVGNHDIHHRSPSISWLSLAIGLRKRSYSTNPFKTIWNMAFNKSFKHYKATNNHN